MNNPTAKPEHPASVPRPDLIDPKNNWRMSTNLYKWLQRRGNSFRMFDAMVFRDTKINGDRLYIGIVDDDGTFIGCDLVAVCSFGRKAQFKHYLKARHNMEIQQVFWLDYQCLGVCAISRDHNISHSPRQMLRVDDDHSACSACQLVFKIERVERVIVDEKIAGTPVRVASQEEIDELSDRTRPRWPKSEKTGSTTAGVGKGAVSPVRLPSG
jgi:hypothetical protein